LHRTAAVLASNHLRSVLVRSLAFALAACTAGDDGDASPGSSGATACDAASCLDATDGEATSAEATSTADPPGAESSGGETDTATTGDDATADSTDGGTSTDPTGDPVAGEFCPADAPCRILPLGDSLTEGDSQGAYRQPLFAMTVAARQPIMFVGSMSNGPDTVSGLPFPRDHEGHSGYYIDAEHHPDINIADLVDDAIATHEPHIILLMIGTNDVIRAHFPDSAERLAGLVDQILAAAPGALLVVARIPPAGEPSDNPDVETYNAAIGPMVAARADAGANVMAVDMYAPFIAVPDYATALLVDNVHPNPEGDAIVAATWYDAISPYLD
jgi:hypothetical protein